MYLKNKWLADHYHKSQLELITVSRHSRSHFKLKFCWMKSRQGSMPGFQWKPFLHAQISSFRVTFDYVTQWLKQVILHRRKNYSVLQSFFFKGIKFLSHAPLPSAFPSLRIRSLADRFYYRSWQWHKTIDQVALSLE